MSRSSETPQKGQQHGDSQQDGMDDWFRQQCPGQGVQATRQGGQRQRLTQAARRGTTSMDTAAK